MSTTILGSKASLGGLQTRYVLVAGHELLGHLGVLFRASIGLHSLCALLGLTVHSNSAFVVAAFWSLLNGASR